ncbi:heparan-alpha-glucosaminide N-acetyltransferase [Shinella sp.]|uniref:heparan-alpha-glucosaminide N-acetyltransferase n=1 Tax=Shinella sp. TaxID=1870904 RepID=UPI003F702601
MDIVRGLAIAGVVLFHVVWDLEFAGFISGVAGHPVWLLFGRCLAGGFMLLVGVSLVLAHRSGFRTRPFLKRLVLIAVSAAAISAVTWFVFPQSFVYFGILHAIAATSLIGLCFIRAPAWASAAAGIAVFAVPFVTSSEIFDTRWLAWIGFASNVPPSNDFVPIFPWSGLTLLGIAATRVALLSGIESRLGPFGLSTPTARSLAWMGRKSLPIYLLHQPVLLAIIVPLSWVLARP